MDDRFTVTFHGDHVRVDTRATDRDMDFAKALWRAVKHACIENDCFNVLGVSLAPRDAPTMYAYAYAEMFKEVGITGRFRIAWVELNVEAKATTRFTETVLLNRGFRGGAFDTEEEALQWLLPESG